MIPRGAAAHSSQRLRPEAASAIALGVVLSGSLLALSVALPTPDALVLVGVAAILAVSAWMFTSRRYEVTLAVLMLYLGLADGYIKLKLDTQVATLGRDLLVYAIATGALLRAVLLRKPLTLPPLSGWVLAWLLIVGIQLFNPYNGTLSHSIQAVRPHVEFVPLFFLGFLVMRTKRRLAGFLVLMLVVSAANGVVGLIQFNLSPDQLASWGPGYEKRVKGTGDVSARAFADDEGNERTRPFALGSDFGFGGIVGLIAVPAALALLSYVRGPPMRLLVATLSGATVLAVVTSQARVAILGAVLAGIAYAALAATSRSASRSLVGVGVAALVAYGAISLLASSSETGAFDRYQDIRPGSAAQTTVDYRGNVIAKVPSYAVDYPFGAGMGSKGPAGSIGGRPAEGGALNGESEPTFLIIELGIAGLIVLFGFFFKLFALAIGRIRLLADPNLRLLLAGISAPLFAIFLTGIAGISSANTPSSPYIWFVGGVLSYWLSSEGGKAHRAVAPPLQTATPL